MVPDIPKIRKEGKRKVFRKLKFFSIKVLKRLKRWKKQHIRNIKYLKTLDQKKYNLRYGRETYYFDNISYIEDITKPVIKS